MRKIAEITLKTALLLAFSAILTFSSGCGLMAGPIISSALGGSLIGGIIGHQSGEALAGALIGGAITGGMQAAKQSDRIAEGKKCEKEQQQITIHTKEPDGSYRPVQLKSQISPSIPARTASTTSGKRMVHLFRPKV
jgi:outer membrane lipoprotein SlyB